MQHVFFVSAVRLTSAVLLCAASAVTLAQTSGPSVPQTYRFTNLGTLGGFESVATGVNDRGEVSGFSTSGESLATRGALWQGRSLTDLGIGIAFGINDHTVVVGDRTLATAWVSTRPVTLQDFSGGFRSAALAISDAGQIAGYSWLPDRTHMHASLWPSISSPAIDLGPVRGVDSIAAAINNRGQAAGSWTTADGFNHAALWTDGVGVDLSLPGELRSFASGLNDDGIAVGASLFLDDGHFHATVWNGASVEVLNDTGHASSFAQDINNQGWIVGSVGDDRFGTGRATLWHDGIAIDLNTRLRPGTVQAGWVLDTAVAINDHGWIVGAAHNDNLGIARQAYLLSISEEPDQFLHPMQPTLIPEPETCSLMLVGLALLGWHRARAWRCSGPVSSGSSEGDVHAWFMDSRRARGAVTPAVAGPGPAQLAKKPFVPVRRCHRRRET